MADSSTSPTPFQLAFALALNRAKPQSISVREYILALRKHTYSGPRPQFSATYEESQSKYINAAFYFESLLKEEQKKSEDLRNRITNLERHHNVTDHCSTRTTKHPTMANTGTIARAESAEDCLDDEFGVRLPSRPSNASLLRHVYNLHISLQESPCSPRKVARLIIRICNAFGRATEPGESSHREIAKYDYNHRTVPLKRIISLIFTAFDRLVASEGQNSSSHKIKSQLPLVTYHIVSLFKTILDCIGSVESKFLEHAASEPSARGVTSCLSELTSSYVKILGKHHVTSSEINVENHKQAYDDLLEGTLYILLKRAGTLLYMCTFSTPRAPSIEGEIAAQGHVIETNTGIQTGTRYNLASSPKPRPPEPSNVSLTTMADDGNGDNPTISANRQHASHIRHLVSLIQVILPLYHRRHSQQPKQINTDTDANSRASTAEPEVDDANAPTMRNPDSMTLSSRADLVQQRLEILQNTLVSGIFGTSEAGELGEMLRSPSLPPREGEDGDGMDGDDDGEGQDDWFARKMWELVGWDILARGLV